MGNFTRLNVTRLKLFVGTREDAYKVALLDADQFVIYKTRHWREDPNKRSEMFFYTEVTDGDCVLLPYCKDLSQPVTSVNLGDSFFLGYSWYDSLDLPDACYYSCGCL